MALQSYESVIEYLHKKKRQKHLLLGNGFSMSYDPEIFSYNALNRFIEELKNPLITKLFNIINTKNFELVMQSLDNFCELANAFSSDQEFIVQIEEASNSLKHSLIDAVKALHPEHVFKISDDKSQQCALLLKEYLTEGGNIFTTNYDILLYWVLMRNKVPNAIDGFGREVDQLSYNVEEIEWSELIWGPNKSRQNVHYVHGALPLFDAGPRVIKEEYNGNYILENINKRVVNKQYPIFVTAGNAEEKLSHILHNQYLTHCYDKLTNITGSLVTFGFNFGEYDDHIIEAINLASSFNSERNGKLFSIYIGVYNYNDEKHINKIKHKFKCKVNLFDAKTVKFW
ncbi:DUF4917 family protein [Colwellia sp. 6_MG-2023]|uniref:DUF4917 family protein n=1 Tax=Colwellia sp. 6_MG-2023 TaxID=3062676 RepID=UPI0026E1ED2C|nr:DUF4917 family protein [Colwellia sp. 6_MG-2023]MDO6487910.1 DUF4917 family protein [Colwellia sp. 6_MG-2023]